MMDSEMENYYYAKTADFEAAVVPGGSAYMLVVLPEKGKAPGQLLSDLAGHPGLVDRQLSMQVGHMVLPEFNFVFESDARQALEVLGVHGVFQILGRGVVNTEDPVWVQEVRQKVDIGVDRQGIRVDAGTVTTGLVGGIMGGGPPPFSMYVNRPFLFFVRDNTTNALLFAGVVADPGQH